MTNVSAYFLIGFTFALCLGGAAAHCQVLSPIVNSAEIVKYDRLPEKGRLEITIANTGQREITAYAFEMLILRDGMRIPCGGKGADMIDWSDPMPGTGIFIHLKRNWIAPNQKTTLDGYPRCPGRGPVPLDQVRAEISYVLFDDGTGEGNSNRIDFALRMRQVIRNERLKWLSGLTALRTVPDLKTASRQLYQAIVEGAHTAEIDPREASREGLARPARDEIKRLALHITEWASTDRPLKESPTLDWAITDLERRTARLSRGAGKIDIY